MERETELLLIDIEAHAGDLRYIMPQQAFEHFIDTLDNMFIQGKRFGTIFAYAHRRNHRLYLKLWFSCEPGLAYRPLLNVNGVSDSILIPPLSNDDMMLFVRNMNDYISRICYFFDTMRRYDDRIHNLGRPLPPGFEAVDIEEFDIPGDDDEEFPEEFM